jgi:hypothetical protein
MLLITWQVPVSGQVVHTPNSLTAQFPVGEVRRARMWQQDGSSSPSHPQYIHST